jgi:hypothetical protein
VLPLAANLGLIEWIPTCDTFHTLVREHRERHHIPLNAEVCYLTVVVEGSSKKLVVKVRTMQHMSPDHETLPVIRRVEVLRHALASHPGDDLAKVSVLQRSVGRLRLVGWLDRWSGCKAGRRKRGLYAAATTRDRWRSWCVVFDFKNGLALISNVIFFSFHFKFKKSPWSATSWAWATGTRPI